MKKTLALVLAVLMLVSVCAFGASAEAGKKKDSVVEAPYGTPVLDGEIDAIWNNAVPQKFNQTSKATNGGDQYIVSSAFDAGQFRVMWDENYLYLLYEINDTTMSTYEAEWAKPGDWLNRDGVGFAIGADFTDTNAVNNKKGTWAMIQAHGVSANFCQENLTMMVCESTDLLAAAGNNQNSSALRPEDKMFRTAETATGYRVEWKINLKNSKLGVQNIELKGGATIAFDAWVNANDDPSHLARNGIYTWADEGAASSTNNARKGTLKLLAKPVAPAGAVAGWTLFNGKDAALEASGSDAKLTSKGNYGGSTTADVAAAFMKTDKVDIKKGITFDVKSMSGLADGTKDAWFAISIMSSASVFDALKKTNPATGVTILGQCASNLQRFAPHTIKAGTFSNFATDAKFKNFLADSSAIIGNNDTVLNFKIKYDETAAQYVILVNDIPMETGDNAKKLSDAIASALDADGKAYITFAMQHAESKTTTAVVSAVRSLAADPTPATGDNTAIFALFAVVALMGTAYVVVRKVRG